MSMNYMQRYYKVPAKRGMKVRVDGREGKIINAGGSHLKVRFTDGHIGWCHPTWRVEYFVDGEIQSFGMENS